MNKLPQPHTELAFIACDSCDKKFPEGIGLYKHQNNKFCKSCYKSHFKNGAINTPIQFAIKVRSESHHKMSIFKEKLESLEDILSNIHKYISRTRGE